MPTPLSSLRAWLPEGHRLPPAQWEARHRALLTVLALHIPPMFLWGLLQGYGPVHSFADIAPLVISVLLGRNTRITRRGRELFVALGLLTASAVLVHLMNGAIEAHFHFFIVVSLLALYEEWFPYLLAFAYVLVHHAVMSAFSASSVFSTHVGMEHPWRTSAVHAAFIAAQGVICLVGWKVNEDSRRAAAHSEKRFMSAFNDAPIGMALVELDGTVRKANTALLSHWDDLEMGQPVVGLPISALVYDPDLGEIAFPGPEVRELRHADGSGWGQWRHAPMRDEQGEQTGWISHCIDVTQRKDLEHDLTWRAHHDALTGLPNRTLFMKRLEDALEQDRGATVAFVDLDQFKAINDTLGHAAGDELLRVIGGRLDSALRPQDVVARFGGDEFVLLLMGIEEESTALSVIERVAEGLREPIMLGGEERLVDGSIGLRLCPAGTPIEADIALRDADSAMYRAKAAGAGRTEVFDEAMRCLELDSAKLEAALHTVLERDELRLVYQPLVDLETRRINGVEALLRWQHPEAGVVSPMEFIPLAEQNGTIVEIGAWVIGEACRQLGEWDNVSLKMSVNVASQQLETPGLVKTVREAILTSGIAPGQLCLEITETAALGDSDITSQTLTDLIALGVQLAVDDFGVGFASLSHLRKLMPVDSLKIDKSFVDGVLEGVEDAAIVEGVIRLAHSLGLEVVAEGVEDGPQADLLGQWGCETGQGYHFSRPVPPNELTERLANEAQSMGGSVPARTLRPAMARSMRRAA